VGNRALSRQRRGRVDLGAVVNHVLNVAQVEDGRDSVQLHVGRSNALFAPGTGSTQSGVWSGSRAEPIRLEE
jgi:hypothetical protein